ncbi:MAG: T9SS type A sorting domain-containing protein [Lewinellaceae bacterium]|nr:T9SS type A sorting domain-containing protein [Lewinellaceae bacterium]
MNTNLSLRLLCFLAILLMHPLGGVAQVSVYPIGCSNLKASLESSLSGERNSYTLEVLKSEGRWMSLHKKHTDQLVSEFANLDKGIYRVKVVASDINSRSLLISDPIAIGGCPFGPGNTTAERVINLRPNPASSTLEIQILPTLQADDLPVTLEIIDGLGHTVETLKLSNANTNVSIAHLPVGIYFATIKNNTKLAGIEKLVVKR